MERRKMEMENVVPMKMILSSPYFWKGIKICRFFNAAHNQIKDKSDDDDNNFKLRLDQDAVGSNGSVWGDTANGWKSDLDPAHLRVLTTRYTVSKKTSKIVTSRITNLRYTSVCDLLGIIRNKFEHNAVIPDQDKEMLGWFVKMDKTSEWSFNELRYGNYWLQKYPRLLVYLWQKFLVFKEQNVSAAFDDFYPNSIDHSLVNSLSVFVDNLPDKIFLALSLQNNKGELVSRYRSSTNTTLEFRTLRSEVVQSVLDQSFVMEVQILPLEIFYRLHMSSEDTETPEIVEERAYSILRPSENEPVTIFIVKSVLDLHDNLNLLVKYSGMSSRLVIFTSRDKRRTNNKFKNRDIINLVEELQSDIPGLEEDYFRWTDLSITKRKEIIKTGLGVQVLLHSREVSLIDILPSGDAEREVFFSELSGDTLTMILRRETFQVGSLPSLKQFYQERRLYRRDLVSNRIFDYGRQGDVFLVTDISLEKLRGKISNDKICALDSTSLELDGPLDNLDAKIVLLLIPVDDFKNQFRTHISSKCECGNNFHFLRYLDGDTFQWLETLGSFSSIESAIEKTMTNSNAMAEADYVNSMRNISKPGKIVFITDEPGMGKSELLVSLGLKLAASKNCIVLLIGFKDFVARLKPGSLNSNSIISAITHFCQCSHLEKKLVEFLLKEFKSGDNLTLEIMLDGFDEVMLEKRDLAIEALKIMQANFASVRVWVTLRDHLLYKIREDFGRFGHKIEPFSEQQQTNLLKEYWLLKFPEPKRKTVYNEVANFASHFVGVINSLQEIAMIGTPLLCWMFAEIYEDHVLSRNFVFKPLKDQVSFTAVFNQLIDKKFQVYFREKKRIPNDISSNDFTSITVRNALENCHIFLAISFIFSEETAEEFKNMLLALIPPAHRQQLFSAVLDLGIVLKLDPLTFVHRTFTEFIIARFVSQVYSGQFELLKMDDPVFQKLLFEHVLSTHKVSINEYRFKFPALCYFLSSILEENDKSRSKLLSYRCELCPGYCGSPLDSSSHSKRHFELVPFFVAAHHSEQSGIISLMIGIPSKISHSVFICSLLCHEYELFKYFVQNHPERSGPQNWTKLQAKEDNRFSIIHWFLINIGGSKNWQEEKKFLQYVINEYKGAGIETPLELKDNLNRTALLCALQIPANGIASELLQFFIEDNSADLNAIDIKGNSILHFAPYTEMDIDPDSDIMANYYTHLYFFKEALEYFQTHTFCNNLLCCKNSNGHTPLLSAINGMGRFLSDVDFKETFDIISLFKAFGADFNARDNSGNLAVHLALENKGSVEFVRQLLDSGTDIYAVNRKGQTALHIAAIKCRRDVIHILLEKAPKLVQVMDHEGKTVFDYDYGHVIL